MQLSIFEEQTTDVRVEPSRQEGSKNIYEKWRMYEYLDHLAEQTAQFVYETKDITIKVPVQIGTLLFSSLGNHGFPNCYALDSQQENCRLNVNARNIDSLVEEGSKLYFRYVSREGDYNAKDQPVIESISSLELLPFEKKRAKLPDLEDINTMEDIQEKVIGKRIKIKTHLRNDFFGGIENSLSFQLIDIQDNNGQLTIEGTNGVEVKCNGLQNIRVGSGILLDCRIDTYTCIHLVD